jgi:aryl carrier-like protein
MREFSIMASEASRLNVGVNLQAQVEQDLANALLHSDEVILRWNPTESVETAEIEVVEMPQGKISYPWNPADPNADAFFTELEQGFSLDDWQEDEMVARSQSFFSHLDQLWTTTSLRSSLAQKFTAMPQTLLNAIAHQAQQVVAASNSLADQLVQCVQEVLPTWADEDLQVLARPLAYAMRDDANAIDATLDSIRPVAWHELSETEQAKMSLAVARWAIDQLSQDCQ